MKSLDIAEVERINDILIKSDPQFLSVSPQALYELSISCAGWKSFTGEQMATAKKIWQDAKRRAYQTFVVSNEANQTRVEKFGVMVIKDYINSTCGEQEANYELIERCNNACGYMIDICRTIISALKEEAKMAGFR